MTLADIRKEEVDPLITHIKNLMSGQSARQLTDEDDDMFHVDPIEDMQDGLGNQFNEDSPLSTRELEPTPCGNGQSVQSYNHQNQPTVDMLVSNLLKPILDDWVNHHLPTLVTQIVTQKIDQLIQDYQESRKS